MTLLVVLLVSFASPATSQEGTWHVRKGALPSIRATRADLEALLADVIRRSDKLPPGTFRAGESEISILASAVNGKMVGSLIPAGSRAMSTSGIDTLRRYLGRKSRLTMLKLTYSDNRSGNATRAIASAEFTFFSAGEENNYSVLGYDRERVNEIAGVIEAFGNSHATWRTPRVGEAIKAAIQTVAILLLPVGIALRDRRFSWAFYPAGLGLMAASHFIPFVTLFSSFAVIGASG